MAWSVHSRTHNVTEFGACAIAVLSIGTALVAAPVRAEESGEGAGRVIDRVVAVVNGRALTQSALELEARVALIRRGAVGAATEPLGQAALRSALDLAIAQRLAGDEADRLQTFQVEESEVEGAIKAFREKLGGERAEQAFLKRADTDASQLHAILARSLRAEKLLDSKVRLRAQVSEADVRREYEARRDLSSRSFEQVRVALHEKLTRDRYQELVAMELTQSRRNADVRLVAPWARGEAGAQAP